MNSTGNLLPLAATQQQASAGRGYGYTLALMAATVIWVVFWYRETAIEIADIWWRSDTFAHGLVVLPICAWLVWRKRAQISLFRPQPAWPAFIGAALGAGLWLLGELVDVNAMSHFALALIIVCSLVGVLGWQLARVNLFALLFLFFGVPIGEFLLPVMMKHTAEFAVFALRLSGVPVYQEGLHFIIPTGRWSVVEACSGVRYLIASLLVGSLYAYLNYRSLKRRLLFVLVALLIPVVANWFRAYLTVMIGHLFGNEFVQGFIHIVYGWVFFGIVIFLMFIIGARWRESASSGDEQQEAALSRSMHAGSPVSWIPVAAIAAVLAATPWIASALGKPVADFAVALESPAAAGEWTPIDSTVLDDVKLGFGGQRGELFQVYRRSDGVMLSLYVGYFAEQSKGHELVTYPNKLDRTYDERWARTVAETHPLEIGNVFHVGMRAGNRVVERWSWYWINGRLVISDYLGKILYALDRLTGQKDDSAVVVLTIPQTGISGSGREIADDFVATYWPGIRAQLEQIERQR